MRAITLKLRRSSVSRSAMAPSPMRRILSSPMRRSSASSKSCATTNGKLIDTLAAVGVAAADVDTIVLTHGHADHIGGASDSGGAPIFPNARYVMWQSEWDFWNQERPDLSAMPVDDHLRRLLIDFAHAKLPPVRSQLDLINR